jgi:hypothetical protein
VQLPPTGTLAWTAIRAAEVEAVHGELFRLHAGSYSIQPGRFVEDMGKELNSPDETTAGRVAELVRANWELAKLRKTIDDAFTDFDLVVLRKTDSERAREYIEFAGLQSVWHSSA